MNAPDAGRVCNRSAPWQARLLAGQPRSYRGSVLLPAVAEPPPRPPAPRSPPSLAAAQAEALGAPAPLADKRPLPDAFSAADADALYKAEGQTYYWCGGGRGGWGVCACVWVGGWVDGVGGRGARRCGNERRPPTGRAAGCSAPP